MNAGAKFRIKGMKKGNVKRPSVESRRLLHLQKNEKSHLTNFRFNKYTSKNALRSFVSVSKHLRQS